MEELPLFRDDALKANRAKWHGDVVLVNPLTAKISAIVTFFILTIVVLYFIFGSYTNRTTVSGQVTPISGLVKLYVQQPGTVIESNISEGQKVEEGQILFVISNERKNNTIGEIQAAIIAQVKKQKEILLKQLETNERLLNLDKKSILSKIETLKSELPKLSKMIESQQERIVLTQESYDRYKQLMENSYVTHEQLMQKQSELLTQRSQLESMEREKIVLQGQLTGLEEEYISLPIKYEQQMAEINKGIASIEQVYTENEGRRNYSVAAPEAGTITTITAREGQWVDNSAPIVTILPANANLQVELYASSRAIGFVNEGDIVSIRYQAFPYQKYGQQLGSVSSIATAPLSSAELTGSNAFASPTVPGGEPLYRILVDLESQQIQGESESYNLKAGMLLEADIMQEERRLYEWILEPLYRITKKTS